MGTPSYQTIYSLAIQERSLAIACVMALHPITQFTYPNYLVPNDSVGVYPVNAYLQPQNVVIDPYNLQGIQGYGTAPPGYQYRIMTVQEYEALISGIQQLEISQKSKLPEWLYDENGNFTVGLDDILNQKLFFTCLKDKKGSRFIQDNFSEAGVNLREQMFDAVFQQNVFYDIAADRFGNFVLQKMIEEVEGEQLGKAIDLIAERCVEMSFDRFSCRVVQKIFDVVEAEDLHKILNGFEGSVAIMSMDQSANHVLQKMINLYSNEMIHFIGAELAADMDDVICNKFGCRVVQFLLEKLCKDLTSPFPDQGNKKNTLRMILDKIVLRQRYCQDEYANYVVQYVLCHPFLKCYATKIIEKSILRNIVMFSTDKFASHVVEKTLDIIDPKALDDIVHDLFTKSCGRNGRLAIEKLMFDQFGNYVIQRLLSMSIEIRQGKRQGSESWFKLLSEKIQENATSLLRYSSGKKILETLSRELGKSLV
uniref:PUM-HD domain-containing protein n=1 Tax=Panagrolaimus sp. JU765 TaxID=591449 RepID=A0AC34RJD2_9BILA